MLKKHIVFFGFKDLHLREFLIANGSDILSEPDKADLIVYMKNTFFRESDIYVYAKKHDIEYVTKENFLNEYNIKYNEGNYEFVDNESESLEGDESEDNKSEQEDFTDNEQMCRFLDSNLSRFYDNIHIPYTYFKDEEWDVKNILQSNTDVLFYNEKYLAPNDKDYFDMVFNKYVDFISPMFVLDSQLGLYFKSWQSKKNSTFLKRTMNEKAYRLISPIYLSDLYKKTFSKYRDNTDLFAEKYKKKLDRIVSDMKKESAKFKIEFNRIIMLYVYEYPLVADSLYTKGFINSIILLILDFTLKLIDLNIYAIHKVVSNIIDDKLRLDDINSHDPEDYDGCKLMII